MTSSFTSTLSLFYSFSRIILLELFDVDPYYFVQYVDIFSLNELLYVVLVRGHPLIHKGRPHPRGKGVSQMPTHADAGGRARI